MTVEIDLIYDDNREPILVQSSRKNETSAQTSAKADDQSVASGNVIIQNPAKRPRTKLGFVRSQSHSQTST